MSTRIATPKASEESILVIAETLDELRVSNKFSNKREVKERIISQHESSTRKSLIAQIINFMLSDSGSLPLKYQRVIFDWISEDSERLQRYPSVIRIYEETSQNSYTYKSDLSKLPRVTKLTQEHVNFLARKMEQFKQIERPSPINIFIKTSVIPDFASKFGLRIGGHSAKRIKTLLAMGGGSRNSEDPRYSHILDMVGNYKLEKEKETLRIKSESPLSKIQKCLTDIETLDIKPLDQFTDQDIPELVNLSKTATQEIKNKLQVILRLTDPQFVLDIMKKSLYENSSGPCP